MRRYGPFGAFCRHQPVQKPASSCAIAAPGNRAAGSPSRRQHDDQRHQCDLAQCGVSTSQDLMPTFVERLPSTSRRSHLRWALATQVGAPQRRQNSSIRAISAMATRCRAIHLGQEFSVNARKGDNASATRSPTTSRWRPISATPRGQAVAPAAAPRSSVRPGQHAMRRCWPRPSPPIRPASATSIGGPTSAPVSTQHERNHNDITQLSRPPAGAGEQRENKATAHINLSGAGGVCRSRGQRC